MTVIRNKRRADIMRSYAAGMPVTLIAARFGCSPSNVTQTVKYHGVLRDSIVEEFHAEPKPEIRAPVAEVKRLAAKGLSITKIGALLRCPYREIALALEV